MDSTFLKTAFKLLVPDGILSAVECSVDYLQYTYTLNRQSYFMRISYWGNGDYRLIAGWIDRDSKSYATVMTWEQAKMLVSLLTTYRDADARETPLCPICGQYIANCEGHTSTILQEPEAFREEWQADKEQDDIMMSQFKE